MDIISCWYNISQYLLICGTWKNRKEVFKVIVQFVNNTVKVGVLKLKPEFDLGFTFSLE